jgi:hypothetical protein
VWVELPSVVLCSGVVWCVVVDILAETGAGEDSSWNLEGGLGSCETGAVTDQ